MLGRPSLSILRSTLTSRTADGAALFTVSASQSTYPSLRSYLIHRLLRTSSPRVAAKHSEIRPQIVDRDRVVVPTGWDSRGKIGALDPTFDCDGIGKASWGELKRIWEDKIRERRGVENVGSKTVSSSFAHLKSHIQALSAKPVIAAEDDQEFLKRLLNGAAPALSSSMPSRAPAGDLDDITAKLARLGKRGVCASPLLTFHKGSNSFTLCIGRCSDRFGSRRRRHGRFQGYRQLFRFATQEATGTRRRK